jgi:hypothetical protein
MRCWRLRWMTNNLAARDRSYDNEWLFAGGDRLRQRRIGRFMREVFFTREEAQEGAALERAVIANGALQHRVPGLERIEHGFLRDRRRNLKFNLAADVRQRSEMVGKNYADHNLG